MKCLVGIAVLSLFLPNWWVAGPVLPPTHSKHRVAEAVCQRIAAAYGNPLVRPRLEISRKSGQIARFDVEPDGGAVLRLDERLYDRCRAYGADSLNALACLVGHEMGHFYQQQGFMPAYDRSAGLAAQSTTDRPRLEAEADRFGLYYGYLAGYDTYRLLPSVLAAVYQDYHLNPRLPGYPTLTERMALAEQERRRFRPLALAFDAGQLLWLTQHDEAAVVCFQHLLNQFRSKEIYNNLGCIRLGQAMRLLPTREVPYAYPFEWDAGNRLRMGTLRSGAPDQQQLTTYLQQAKDYFKAAQQLDPAYAPAAINLACTYSLLANQEGSISTVQELEELCQTQHLNLPANALLIKAIAYARNEQPARATACFNQAVQQRAFQATYNRDVFRRSQPRNALASLAPDWSALEHWIQRIWSTAPTAPNLGPRENAIGPFRFTDWLTKPATRDTLLLPQPTSPVHIIQQTAMGVRAMRLLTADQQLEVLSTTPTFRAATRAGLRVGHPLSEVQARYGAPNAVLLSAGNRQFWHYKAVAMLIEVADGHVKGWHLYRY